jgi:hypothetical protein
MFVNHSLLSLMCKYLRQVPKVGNCCLVEFSSQRIEGIGLVRTTVRPVDVTRVVQRLHSTLRSQKWSHCKKRIRLRLLEELLLRQSDVGFGTAPATQTRETQGTASVIHAFNYKTILNRDFSRAVQVPWVIVMVGASIRYWKAHDK